MNGLKSSVEQQGKLVTKIIVFSGGNKKTIRNILTETIEQGEFTKFKSENNILYLINTKNVDFVEVFSQN